MASKLDITLHGSSVDIVRQYEPLLRDILQSKFGCAATISGTEFEVNSQLNGPNVGKEKRLEVMFSGIKVSVWKADLTNFVADAVVNAANEYLKHFGGLALALSKAGGWQIQAESDDYIKKNNHLKTGEAIIMDAWSLPYKKIIHVVGPKVPHSVTVSDGSKPQKELQMAIWNCLKRAKESHLKTIAIPAVSSGIFGYPLPQCADNIVSTVKKFCEELKGSDCLKEIMLVNNDERTVKEMERACDKILTSHPSMRVKGNNRTDTRTVFVQVGNVHLKLKKGLIEDEQTDVIVNTTAKQNWRCGQISNAILQKAGRKLEDELNNSPIKGNIIITKAHKLKCKEVYHILLGEIESQSQVLSFSVTECLRLAALNDQHSIAFPALGTGNLRCSKENVAKIMTDAVANFNKMGQRTMEVYFVIYPSDNETFKAFKDQMTRLQQQASDFSFTHVHEHQDDFRHSRHSRASTPWISLSGPSHDATYDAGQWLSGLLFKTPDIVHIYNNFIMHFSEEEHQLLSQLMNQKHVIITESLESGRASISVCGDLTTNVVVAVLQVEAMLCKIQREFIQAEEHALFCMSKMNLSFETSILDHSEPSNMLSSIKHEALRLVKVVGVKNDTLKWLFDQKKEQLGCLNSHRMFQFIPAQFCEMVSRVGFQAEFAPPDDPAYGEGIYFAGTIDKAMEMWKDPKLEFVHLVVAEVLTGNSTPGRQGLVLPPTGSTEPLGLYKSVSGGKDISVIFSGYQALPTYIVTYKKW